MARNKVVEAAKKYRGWNLKVIEEEEGLTQETNAAYMASWDELQAATLALDKVEGE